MCPSVLIHDLAQIPDSALGQRISTAQRTQKLVLGCKLLENDSSESKQRLRGVVQRQSLVYCQPSAKNF